MVMTTSSVPVTFLIAVDWRNPRESTWPDPCKSKILHSCSSRSNVFCMNQQAHVNTEKMSLSTPAIGEIPCLFCCLCLLTSTFKVLMNSHVSSWGCNLSILHQRAYPWCRAPPCLSKLLTKGFLSIWICSQNSHLWKGCRFSGIDPVYWCSHCFGC